MAIAFRNSNVGKSAAGGGTYSVTKPTGTIDGDVLIAVVSLDAGTASTITWPAGWTLIRYDNDGGGFSIGQEIRYRVASGEGASWSWTVTGVDSQCAVLGYTGAVTPTPTDVSNGGPAVTTATCNAPTVTPGFTDDLLLCIYSSTHNGTPTASTITLDAALTSRINSLSTGSIIRLAIGEKQLASAAATGNITATMVGTTDTKIGSQVAIKTASTGQDTPELRGRPFGLHGQQQMHQLLAQ